MLDKRILAGMVVLAGAAGAAACRPASTPRTGDVKPMNDEGAADLALVRRSRVYFYHHSVGVNVLAGLQRLDASVPGGEIRSVWIEEAPAGADGPFFVHGGGGENAQPKTKVDFFASTLRSGRVVPDLAFMKFCYVDFTPTTDVDELFAYYRRTLESLKQDHPDVTFAHVTVPLMQRPTDAKNTLRRLVGREVWEDAANARRGEFNRRLRETFGSDPIFDLSTVESTAPDGSRVTFRFGAETYPSLHPGYTTDGGHLNDEGQRAAADAALRFLAGALRGRSVR